MLFIPTKVLAYGIENYFINATVEKNGDLEVEEYFEMNGEFNGMERIIKFKNSSSRSFNPDADSYGGHNLHNGDGIEIEEVRAVNVDDNFDFNNVEGTKFRLVNYGNKGDYGIYTESPDYDGKSIKIFLPSSKYKAFYVKYKLHNMAILHNDVGELGWNIFGTQLTESINNLVVYINIPNNNNIRVWAHGPLNGESKILSNDKVKISLRGLNSRTAIDARITFDKNVISESTKKTNVDGLNKIIKYETDLAEEANRRREESDKMYLEYIENGFNILDKKSSRANYNDVEKNIIELNNSDKKTECYKKLYSYQPKVDEYEYKRFKAILNGDTNTIDNNYYSYSFESKEMRNYKYANNIIDNVFDLKLKSQMREELKTYYKKIQMKDLKKEAIICLVSISTLLITLFVYYKPIKFKKRVNPMYFRDIPSDLSPAAAGILVDKQINKNEVSASILDLVRRKIIIIEKKDNNSYDFVLNEEYDNLSEIDQHLVLLIFPNKNSKRVNSKKIGKITSTKFIKFKESVIDELENKKLMKDYVPGEMEVSGILFELGLIILFIPGVNILGIIFMILYSINRYKQNFFIWMLKMFNIILMIISIIINNTAPHISIIVGIVVMIWISRLLKRMPIKQKIKYTETGLEEYKKWHGLRNFLMDFSKIDDREIPEVTLWEKYLVYATALGVSKKVLEAIRVKIEQIDNVDYTILSDMATIDYVSSSINRISNNVVTQSLPSVNFPIASAIASSSASGGSYSSGSGGGGGFSGGSSGGGSFGGGGGGGRF